MHRIRHASRWNSDRLILRIVLKTGPAFQPFSQKLAKDREDKTMNL
jgi:hypothetical protein